MNVQEFYEQALIERGFVDDASQRKAVRRLQCAYDNWLAYETQQAQPLMRFFSRPQVPRGVYLWGGVGTGKSFLMDSFYSVVPIKQKTRVHFHEFMRDVHRDLDSLKLISDPLDEIAANIGTRYHLICFDEFHVIDVADAMILHNLFSALFERGVSFIFTSNFEPDTLYPDGLHRDRMLRTIALLKANLDVLQVDGGIDYRSRALSQISTYHCPFNRDADNALRAAFERIAESTDEAPVIDIDGRPVRALRVAGGLIWFDFATLCGGPRSQNDYLDIARRFHTVVLSGIPVMSPEMASEVRRFIWLIDVLYDLKIRLIASAEAGMEHLYVKGPQLAEFQRTVSRLREMQSEQYVNAKRARVQHAA